jgi:hypothetical protein
LLFLALPLFAQGVERRPTFVAEDIRVVEASVAGHEIAQVFETSPAPNLNTQALVS